MFGKGKFGRADTRPIAWRWQRETLSKWWIPWQLPASRVPGNRRWQGCDPAISLRRRVSGESAYFACVFGRWTRNCL